MTAHSPSKTDSTPIRVGVIGVGAMGENHARVYSELNRVDLVAVTDLDAASARATAAEFETEAVPLADLLERCDVVSVAVPTPAHFETVTACLEANVHVLVEKPITESIDEAETLARTARERELVLQVGHIERFNPAVQGVLDLVEDLDVIAVDAKRLGPPVERTGLDGVTYDLMVHDVDVLNAVLDGTPEPLTAARAANGQYASATITYDDVVASLTASRVTQKKIRKLTVTARECLVEVDYLEQSILIHRDSYPAYVTDNGQNRYRHESVIERPRIDNGEPLRHELESFLEAVRNGTEPQVTAEDGIRAVETIKRLDQLAEQTPMEGPTQ